MHHFTPPGRVLERCATVVASLGAGAMACSAAQIVRDSAQPLVYLAASGHLK